MHLGRIDYRLAVDGARHLSEWDVHRERYTRNESPASIITTLGARKLRQEIGVRRGMRSRRRIRTALLMGAVTTAPGRPFSVSATDSEMASIVAAAFALSGLPGLRVARALV